MSIRIFNIVERFVCNQSKSSSQRRAIGRIGIDRSLGRRSQALSKIDAAFMELADGIGQEASQAVAAGLLA